MRTCTVCGEQSPSRARFCWNCGSPLPEGLEARDEERRLVTVLFCDLVGFTQRSDGADPEDVKATLRAFHPLVQREIDAHGGVVNQFVGDGVLALFGSPVAHEDDAERAVRAGLRIQASITELNDEQPDLRLRARVGIETGEVLVSAGIPTQFGGTVAGDVVNTASRLQGLAPPGGVVVGVETFRATGSGFLHEPMPAVEVKGKGEPLLVWRVTGPRSLVPNEARRRFRTSLIGRDDELHVLETAFRRAIEGTAGFVVITGEAGVGKTRLLAELAGIADRAPTLVRWRQGRPTRFGEGGAFGALAEVVKAEAGVLDSDGREQVGAKVRHAIEQLTVDAGERDVLERAVAPLVGIGPADHGDEPVDDARREEAFGHWRRFVELMATDDPLVLVIDDAHEATGAFLDFIDHLVGLITDLPMLLIVAGRPELAERRPEWGTGSAVALQVRPLPDRELTQLVRLLIDDVELTSGTIGEVVERSEGIPLFAEEFAQMLRERALDGDGDGDAGEGAEIDVPASLRSLVAARLDGLPGAERNAIQDAAVVGRSFWPGAVAAVAGDGASVGDVLSRLADRELVRRVRPSSVAGEEEYTFWHPLVRDVAYAQIPRAERARRHRAVAGWIEDLAGDRSADRAEQLAQHYGQALALARAAGDPEAASLVEPAARFTLLAAERAAGFDPERADRLYTRTLAMLPQDHPDRARALRGAGVTASALARFEQGEAALRASIDAYRACDDEIGRADAMVALSRTLVERAEFRQADELLAEALVILEARPPGPSLARAVARHAGHLFLVGRNEECVARAEQALRLAEEHGLPREEVIGRNYLGAARAFGGDPAGLDDLRGAVRRGMELGLGAETAIAMNNLSNVLRYLEGPRASLESYEELERFCHERGFATALTWAWSGEMEGLFETGDWDRMQTIADRTTAWEAEHGRSIAGAAAILLVAWAALRRGDVATAASIAGGATDRAERWGTTEYDAPTNVLRAEVALATGRRDDALAELDGFRQAAGIDRIFTLSLTPVVVRIAVAAGDIERAERIVGEAVGTVAVRDRLSIETARAVVDEARGRHAQALGTFADLAAAWRGYGFALEEGMNHLAAARCASALGHGAVRHDHAAAAAAIFEQLRAGPLLGEARAIDAG